MSNLNKFKDSYQVFENNSRLCLMRKKKIKDSFKECLNNFFWPKIFTTNILCANVYKMYNVTRTKWPIVMQIISKSQIYRNFGPFIEHGLPWINFTILTFISETIDTLEVYIKFWTKLFCLTCEKNVKCKIGHRNSEKKMNVGVLKVQMWYPNHAWTQQGSNGWTKLIQCS
jgi:hypothetical protein